MDPRVRKLAKTLINYSLKLKKGQLVKIQGEPVAMPLIEAAFEEALKVGAHPYINLIAPAAKEIFLKNASDAQIKFITPMQKLEVDKIDALLAIWGTDNTRSLSGVDPKRQALASKSAKSIFAKLMKRIGNGSMSWVGTQFPTLADAQEAEMSLSDYEDFVYRAGHVVSGDPVKHWTKVHKEQDRLIKILNRFSRLHVKGNGTDLKMNIKGRKWINCAGTENFPDGEIFTSPLENSVEGHITFSYPAVYMGREVENVRLDFKGGKVVQESADKNLEFLTQMLNTDKGARFVGEFAIGTNYEIQRFSSNTLFDEKIGGTCHLAVGASIPEAGGNNVSAIHWDMVCDLKKNGQIEADGKIIYANGKFKI